MDLNNPDSKWSYARSVETENLIFFWEKGFGNDLDNPPMLEGKPMRFNLDNLKNRVEEFYGFFRDSLPFPYVPPLRIVSRLHVQHLQVP